MTKRKVADLFSLHLYCTTVMQKVNEKSVNNPLNFRHFPGHFSPFFGRSRAGSRGGGKKAVTGWRFWSK